MNIKLTSNFKSFYNKIKDLFFLIIIIFVICFIFKDPDIIIKSVENGLTICGNIVLPSLFPFMIICNFISLSPIVKIVSKVISPLTKVLFKLPESVGCIIIMSFIGGYPMGAKMVADFLERREISEEVADRLMCFCVNAGPAFIITAIGYMVWGNKKIGVILLISHILSSIIIGIILGFFCKKINFSDYKIKPLQYSQAFVKSVVDASYTILHIFSFIIIFSVITDLIKVYCFSNQEFLNIFLSFLEITVGIKYIINLNGIWPLLLSSFLISFSGISVIFQVFYFIKNFNLNRVKIVVFRLFHGILSMSITYLFVIFNKDIKCTSFILNNSEVKLFNLSPFISVMIVMLTLIFIIFTYDDLFNKNNVDNITL